MRTGKWIVGSVSVVSAVLAVMWAVIFGGTAEERLATSVSPHEATSTELLTRRNTDTALLSLPETAPADELIIALSKMDARIRRLEGEMEALANSRGAGDYILQRENTTTTEAPPEQLSRMRMSFLNDSLAEHIARSGDAAADEHILRTAALNVSGPEPRIVSTECGDMFCRVQMEHNSEQEMEKYFLGLLDKLAWPGAAEAHVLESSESGGVRAVYYVARQGKSLPPSESP